MLTTDYCTMKAAVSSAPLSLFILQFSNLKCLIRVRNMHTFDLFLGRGNLADTLIQCKLHEQLGLSALLKGTSTDFT